MTITIYGTPLTRAGRCLWAAEELGLDYKLEEVDMSAGDHKAPAYLAINPNGKLPALKHDDVVLFESMAINLYLARTFGKGSLQPDTAKDEALAQQWSFWVATECERALLHGILHAFGIMGFEKNAEKVKEQRAALEQPLTVLDGVLKGRQYLVGDRFTVADLNVASVFQWGAMAKMDMAPHANVQAWQQRFFARPACKTVGKMAQDAMAKMG